MLTKITLPEGLTSLGNLVFRMSGLTEIVIPSTVSLIGDSAFNFCEDLTRAVIMSGVTEIKSAVFASTDLKELYIPKSVTVIGSYVIDELVDGLTVYYEGTESERALISFGEDNGVIQNAKWEYSFSPDFLE